MARQTVEKGVLTPWPPLRGGSARRRWGRELYGCPKYFGLWQGSLPPPLRGTAPPLAQAPPPPYRGSLSRRGRFFATLSRRAFGEAARNGQDRSLQIYRKFAIFPLSFSTVRRAANGRPLPIYIGRTGAAGWAYWVSCADFCRAFLRYSLGLVPSILRKHLEK